MRLFSPLVRVTFPAHLILHYIGTDHDVLQHARFSSHPLTRTPPAQLPSSAPYSRTPY